MVSNRYTKKIYVHILDACSNGAGKTQIVYECNLNFRAFESHMDNLIRAGLIRVETVDCRSHYFTTDKGREVLSRLNALIEMLSL
ncbi:MAG: hypothetical protein A4E45_00451 [Methanosaeta sp. PtaB.Bin039]|nr:MAG: hypothetical protein A4E45_00451 [Methanosaeta sp. PtaB.Bin039]OPY45982.1 MAG: hypothetical protein A4E47_00786 [Methanosaeta sp. PtaU1.Bin028]HOT07064.1 winged helix-turn-helix domain-containing protein [Methanotrichaceae archaeon]HQF17101.1 winged helix-turn-helix domain-containing protein [Methanotrichaceae archaeon]HQI91722.1 winged helix-turn-helix domain-containing protein [Methanotrichaceae archaeon]